MHNNSQEIKFPSPVFRQANDVICRITISVMKMTIVKDINGEIKSVRVCHIIRDRCKIQKVS